MYQTSIKPEKIASALYLITSFFADQEPLKWRLRTLASDMVSVGVSLTSQMFKEREAARLEVRSIVLEMNGLIALSKNAGLISMPNYDLMNSELLKYLEVLGFPAGLQEEQGQAVLSKNFFVDDEKSLPPPKTEVETHPEDKTAEKKMTYLPENLNYTKENLSQGQISQGVEHKEREAKPLKEFGAVSVKKNSRQSVIIALLKRKKEIMIKDVSPLISGCSEKTIQRELSAMVQAGILRKTGEKRWSRYSLA